MNFNIRRGDIFYVERSRYQVGSEQMAGRPAIVVSNDENNRHSGTVEIVYLTTAPKTRLPTHVKITSAPRVSTALCEQVTTVSVERFGNYIGRCTRDEMFRIDIAIVNSVGIKIPELRRHLNDNNASKEMGSTEKCEAAPETNEADPPSADTAAMTKIQAERDLYRELYLELLGRVVPVG